MESYFEKYCMGEGEWEFIDEREEYESEYGIIGSRGKIAEKLIKPKFYHHMPAIKIRDMIGNKIWDEYYKFCVVRNPYEKILSAFFHFVVYDNKITESRPELINIFREWVKSGKKKMFDDNAFIIDGKICMDYFIRHENILEGIKHVCDVLDIAYIPEALPKLKSEFKPTDANIYDYFDIETARIIENRFKLVFELFNYKLLF